MKWQRRLGVLFLLIGFTVAILPLLQKAYGNYSQWQLEREFEAQMQAEQGKSSLAVPDASPLNAVRGLFSIRTAHAESLRGAKPARPSRLSRSSTSVSTTSRRRAVPQSRHRGKRMGLVRIEIPRLDMRAIVVDGTSNAQLARGPAHFTWTAQPGQAGNCAIAAHRNMYGSWFKDLNRLRSGDQIVLRTPKEAYTYRVTHSKIVLSNDTSVLRQTKKPTLTLVTCMIPYAKHRLIVFGQKV